MADEEKVNEAAQRWRELLDALPPEDRERVEQLVRERLHAADPAGRWRQLLRAARRLVEGSPVPATMTQPLEMDGAGYVLLCLACRALEGEEDSTGRTELAPAGQVAIGRAPKG